MPRFFIDVMVVVLCWLLIGQIVGSWLTDGPVQREERLKDGRYVACLEYPAAFTGGISCDWARARKGAK